MNTLPAVLDPVEILDVYEVPALAEHPVAVYLRRLSAGSRPSMLSSLRQVLAALGPDLDVYDFPWQSLRYSETSAIRSVLAERFAPATGNRAIAGLRGVMKEAWRLGLLDHESMARATDLPPIRGSRVQSGRYVPVSEQSALFAACAADSSPAGRRDAAVLALGFGAGLRRAEMAALAIGDWDRATGHLLVSGKGRKQRLTPPSPGAVRALEAWIAVRGDHDGPLLLAINKGGRQLETGISGAAILEILERRALESGVPALKPHDLRRTYVSDALDSGADLSVVQQLAGHANPATTARYDRRGERARDEAAGRLMTPYVPAVAVA